MSIILYLSLNVSCNTISMYPINLTPSFNLYSIGTSIPNIRATPKPQSSGIADLFNNAIQTGTDAKGNYLTKEQRISAFKKGSHAKPTKGIKPITSLSRKGGPIGKIGKPEDIAYTALFLASNEANYITGQTITVDGGRVIN